MTIISAAFIVSGIFGSKFSEEVIISNFIKFVLNNSLDNCADLRASFALRVPAVLGRSFLFPITSKILLLASCLEKRFIARVTNSAPEELIAFEAISSEGYFPVPTISLDE